MDIKRLLSELTLPEKAAVVSGTDFLYTNPVPRLNIPSLSMADGPHGLRKQFGIANNGFGFSEPSTVFPAAATTACSWNKQNLYDIGQALATECLSLDINIILGPGVNIKRNPLCGRNFEYFSEDPYLTGKLGTALARGIQSEGIGVSVKHFAANNQENYRQMGNSIVDERALREIYLKAFERIVKETNPYTVMCAYNQLNGEFCSENKWLLTDVLRKEWGFRGAVISDWGAVKDRIKGIKAGLDLEMPGDTPYCRRSIIDAVENGALSMPELDKAVENVLRLVAKFKGQERRYFDIDAHHYLSGRIAADSAVLLKNNGGLPLNKKDKLFILGELFERMRYQGSGSSMINPTLLTSPKDAFDSAHIEYEYEKGYLEDSFKVSKKILKRALKAAEKHNKIIVFCGLTDYAETEGCDRADLKLPDNQIALIENLIERGKKIILVMFGGSPVEFPFIDGIDAVLNMYLPGQNGGTAVKKLLFGEINPSGKLAETWVKNYSDVPFYDEYSKNVDEVYKESIFVGYRYYDTFDKEVLFPFGYGLSYTRFEYFGLSVKENNGEITVTCNIKNTGKLGGSEIVQLYVKNNESKVPKASKELRACTKVFVNPGETKTAHMFFYKKDLSYYNTAEKARVLENGEYEIQVAASSADIRLKQKFVIEGQKSAKIPEPVNQEIPSKRPLTPYHTESRLIDFRKTFIGRIMYFAVTAVARKERRKAKRLPEGPERNNGIKGAYFLKKTLDNNCLRSVSMSAGTRMPYNTAEALAEFSNGHFIRGLKKLKAKILVPPLPKEEKK